MDANEQSRRWREVDLQDCTRMAMRAGKLCYPAALAARRL